MQSAWFGLECVVLRFDQAAGENPSVTKSVLK